LLILAKHLTFPTIAAQVGYTETKSVIYQEIIYRNFV